MNQKLTPEEMDRLAGQLLNHPMFVSPELIEEWNLRLEKLAESKGVKIEDDLTPPKVTLIAGKSFPASAMVAIAAGLAGRATVIGAHMPPAQQSAQRAYEEFEAMYAMLAALPVPDKRPVEDVTAYLSAGRSVPIEYVVPEGYKARWDKEQKVEALPNRAARRAYMKSLNR